MNYIVTNSDHPKIKIGAKVCVEVQTYNWHTVVRIINLLTRNEVRFNRAVLNETSQRREITGYVFYGKVKKGFYRLVLAPCV